MFSSQESVPRGFTPSSDAGSVQTRLSPSTAQFHICKAGLLVSASQGSITKVESAVRPSEEKHRTSKHYAVGCDISYLPVQCKSTFKTGWRKKD